MNKYDNIVAILNGIWCSIDFESMSSSRKKSIWDEFSNKVRAAATSSITLETFIEKMAKKFNIANLELGCNAHLISMKEEEKQECLKMCREELIMVILSLRMKRDEEAVKYKERSKKKNEIKKTMSEIENELKFDKLTEGCAE